MNDPGLELTALPGEFSVCRQPPTAAIPAPPASAQLWALLRSETELSLVVPRGSEPPGAQVDAGWRALRVAATHGLEVTGVTAALTQPLAESGIPLLVIGSHDTDHLLVPSARYREAVARLTHAGLRIVGPAS